MDTNNIKKLITQSKKKIVIVPHTRPDADALGSSLALNAILKKLGHKTFVISPTEFPNFLSWMIGSNEVIKYSNKDHQKIKETFINADIIFMMDFSSLSRTNELGEFITESKAVKITIDHHPSNEQYDDIRILDIHSPATAVLLYQIISKLKLKEHISKNIAECILAGIMTDTGSFQNPNTTAEAHNVAAELIDLGANTTRISKNIYNCNSINRLKFLGFAITNRLTILEDRKAAYFAIKRSDWLKFDLKIGDTEGLVNYALSIEGIDLAVLISDNGDCIRLSFRSSGDIIVNKLAKKYFDGGGHKYAAGGKSFDSLEQTVEKFRKILTEEELLKN